MTYFYECKRYNNYWNPRKDLIAHFTLFLEFNSNTFSFGESIFFLNQQFITRRA